MLTMFDFSVEMGKRIHSCNLFADKCTLQYDHKLYDYNTIVLCCYCPTVVTPLLDVLEDHKIFQLGQDVSSRGLSFTRSSMLLVVGTSRADLTEIHLLELTSKM